MFKISFKLFIKTFYIRFFRYINYICFKSIRFNFIFKRIKCSFIYIKPCDNCTF